MPGTEAIRAAMESGLIAADMTLARLVDADIAVGAVDGAESGDLGIGPMLVFRPQGFLKPIKQEHVEALANAGLLKPDVTLTELVDLAVEDGLIQGAGAELIGPWFALRQLPAGLDRTNILPPQQ